MLQYRHIFSLAQRIIQYQYPDRSLSYLEKALQVLRPEFKLTGEPPEQWNMISTSLSEWQEVSGVKGIDLLRQTAERRKPEPSDPIGIFMSPLDPENEGLVSVIVPTYNRPDTLRRALESILAQTYINIEVIVVNDCGADASVVVHDLNKNDNITYIRHGKNKGLAGARNTGLAIASGQYICYLDDDDLYYPEHVETLVSALKNSESKVAYTNAFRAYQKLIDDEWTVVERDQPFNVDFSADRFLVQNYIPVNTIMHERVCINKSGVFDETMTTHEDWDLWVRMSRYYDFLHINAITTEFSYRLDGTSMTSSGTDDFWRTMKLIHEKYQEYVGDRDNILQSQECNRHNLAVNRVSYIKEFAVPTDQSGFEPLLSARKKLMEGKTLAAFDTLKRLVKVEDALQPWVFNELTYFSLILGEKENAGQFIRSAARLLPKDEAIRHNRRLVMSILSKQVK